MTRIAMDYNNRRRLKRLVNRYLDGSLSKESFGILLDNLLKTFADREVEHFAEILQNYLGE